MIKYEDLIQSGESTLREIYRFLALTPHFSAPLNRDGNEPYFSAWQKLLDDSGTASRPHPEKYEQEVQAYGYSLTDLHKHAPVVWGET